MNVRRQCRHGAASAAHSPCAGNPKTGDRMVERTSSATSVGIATMRMGSIICSSHPFSDSERRVQSLDVSDCGAKSPAGLSGLDVQIRRRCDKYDRQETKSLVLGLLNDLYDTVWRWSPSATAKKKRPEGTHLLRKKQEIGASLTLASASPHGWRSYCVGLSA